MPEPRPPAGAADRRGARHGDSDHRRELIESQRRVRNAVLGVLDLPTDRERRQARDELLARAPELFQASPSADGRRTEAPVT